MAHLASAESPRPFKIPRIADNGALMYAATTSWCYSFLIGDDYGTIEFSLHRGLHPLHHCNERL